MTVMTERVHITPDGSGRGVDPAQLFRPDEFHVVERPDGILEVHDPLFAEPYSFGDRSLVPDPVIDDLVLAACRHFDMQGSVRQLTNTEQWASQEGISRWSRIQHMLSAAAITAKFGGRADEVGAMAIHDVGHRVGSHNAEAMLDDRHAKKQNLHDQDMLGFLKRSGFTARLVKQGLLSENGILANGVPLARLTETDAKTFINWPSGTKSLEVERLQYIEHEMTIWQHPAEVVRAMHGHIRREPQSEHGDHLVIDDIDAAYMLGTGQVDCYAGDWADPVKRLGDALSMVLFRHSLVSKYKGMEEFQKHSPADVLYTTEEKWQEGLTALRESDPAVSGLFKTLIKLHETRRRVFEARDGKEADAEPVWPSWVQSFRSGRADGILVRHSSGHQGPLIIAELGPTKKRQIDPWVQSPGERMKRLSKYRPDFLDYRERRTRWLGAYDHVIALSSRRLGLTPQELKGLSADLGQRGRNKWQQALRRPPMSPEQFAAYIQAGANDYRRRGTFVRAVEQARTA
jgi:hypothetical protein